MMYYVRVRCLINKCRSLLPLVLVTGETTCDVNNRKTKYSI